MNEKTIAAVMRGIGQGLVKAADDIDPPASIESAKPTKPKVAAYTVAPEKTRALLPNEHPDEGTTNDYLIFKEAFGYEPFTMREVKALPQFKKGGSNDANLALKRLEVEGIADPLDASRFTWKLRKP